ncbi:MAG: hypothetical protein WC516_07240 [Patescibacteria group bacterium]|jgi:hypothetical protein
MFSKMIFREADIYLKSGVVIKGFITNIHEGFMEINEHGLFKQTMVCLGEVAAIRGQSQNVPHDKYNIKEDRQFYPVQEINSTDEANTDNVLCGDVQNTVRLAAKINKRPNDFSMAIPTTSDVVQTSYTPPSFVRNTNRSEK